MASLHPFSPPLNQISNLDESLTFSGSKFLKCKIKIKPYPSPSSRPECLTF